MKFTEFSWNFDEYSYCLGTVEFEFSSKNKIGRMQRGDKCEG